MEEKLIKHIIELEARLDVAEQLIKLVVELNKLNLPPDDEVSKLLLSAKDRSTNKYTKRDD